MGAKDWIELRQMAFFGRHGCLAEEREHGQKFLVDVRLCLSLADAGSADDLTKTVDYVEVFRAAQSIVEGSPVKLIEAVAENIAAVLLERFPVESVQVAVHKPDSPMEGEFGDIVVHIERGRRP